MKKSLFLKISILMLLVIWPASMFAQEAKNVRKIHFIYCRKSNFIVNDEGVYADTLLMKAEFPKLKFTKRKNPENGKETFGFVPLKMLSDEDRQHLISALYHSGEILEGTYDAKRNKTTITCLRDDKSVVEIFRKYFKKEYKSFKYVIEIDFNKMTISHDFPMTSSIDDFSKSAKEIKFTDSENLSGMYRYQSWNMLMENAVTMNADIDKHVVPGEIFTNNKYGIKEILSVYDSVELKSISYQ